MNMKLPPSRKRRFQYLLMKAVDNEMSGDEPHEFERFLNGFGECKREWQQLTKLKAVIQDMKFRYSGQGSME